MVGTQRRRRRSSDLEDLRRSEVFAALDPNEKAKIARGFNDLQGRTDGASSPSSPSSLLRGC